MARRRRRRRLVFSLPTLFKAKHWIRLLWRRPPANGDEEKREIGQTTTRQLKNYSFPIYAGFRHEGRSAKEAYALTYGLLARLLAGRFNDRVDRQNGRFRVFLRELIEQLADADPKDLEAPPFESAEATKCMPDKKSLEAGFKKHPGKDESLAEFFDRGWADVIFKLAFEKLEEDYVYGEKEDVFKVLQMFLPGRGGAPGYSEVADDLSMSTFQVKDEVHMMKRLWRELVRTQVEATLANPADITNEVQHLTERTRH